MENTYEKEHRTITENIDFAYVSTIMGVSDIRSWIQRKSGPGYVVFLGFYKPFYMLFETTCKSSTMLEKKELCEDLRKWFSEETIDKNRMLVGIELFERYQEELFNTGILTIKR
jgi:hypothetical protein